MLENSLKNRRFLGHSKIVDLTVFEGLRFMFVSGRVDSIFEIENHYLPPP